jgi:hypothetical protein
VVNEEKEWLGVNKADLQGGIGWLLSNYADLGMLVASKSDCPNSIEHASYHQFPCLDFGV